MIEPPTEGTFEIDGEPVTGKTAGGDFREPCRSFPGPLTGS